MTQSKSDRYVELDSLRGIAAFVVFIGHCMLLFSVFWDQKPTPRWADMLRYTPLHAFWAGGEAVFLFFILSGFVLSLQFLSANYRGYSPFIIKRIFRLYVPYITAIILAIGIYRFVPHHHDVQQLSSWFNGQWVSKITPGLIVNHFLMVGSYNEVFDAPTWSLVDEMRISMIFPMLMLLINRFNWKVTLGLAVVLSIVPYRIYHLVHIPALGNYPFTLTYIPMFIVGALLAKHRHAAVATFERMSKYTKFVLFIVSICLFTYPTNLPNLLVIHKPEIDNWAVTIGATLLMTISISSTLASRILHAKPIVFMGKISYSFYLYHMVVLMSFVSLLIGHVALWIILPSVLFISLVAATLSYYFVEVPSMRKGRTLARKWSKKQNIKAASISRAT